ncbi:MAG: RNA polymerase-binding protein DksA [Alphaproteobacteria bacterium]|nr:MAG: RNA polymerase-binding protein DksA [Alphaproteobacteria bacterium]
MMTAKPQTAVMTLAPDYKPSTKEEYMCPAHLEYFRRKLIAWKEEILRESKQTLHHIQEESLQQPDITDRASLETDMALELRTRDRERKLISKIDAAMERIEQGEYGYCEETGAPIGLARLEARPIATLCLEAQESHEKYERTHRDEDKE